MCARGVILCVLVPRTVVKLGIKLLFWKTLHENSYHVWSSIAFRANGVGNGLGHGIVCRNEAILGTCVSPGMGSKPPGSDFQSDPRATRFPFSRCLNGFFCEAATWGAFKVWARPCAVIGDRLRTTYHMPYARVGILGMHTASSGVPPNPLETDRIWTRGILSVTQ
jgi:hypothetical protein